MTLHYHSIFTSVAEKINEVYGIHDTDTRTLYLNIIKQLGPHNDYTFQQIMMEYLSEFQIKGLYFYNKNATTHNGFHVNKKDDVLEVIEVNDDNRLVVGDRITSMSDDAIPVLEQRYQKILYHEDDNSQDWTHIISKQSTMTVERGDQTYTFDIERYPYTEENRVQSYEGYQIATIYNFDEAVDLVEDLPVILDLRYARGIQPNHYKADVILMSRHTKGSPELFIQQSDAYKIGEPTFGAANKYATEDFDDFVFLYGVNVDSRAIPDEIITNEATEDKILMSAKSKILG